MYRVGLSSSAFLQLTDDNFAAIRKSGLEAIEISLQPDMYKDINYKELKALSVRHEVELWSYHLPFLPFETVDLSSLDKSIRDYTVSYFSEMIKKGSDIGIGKFVVHPSAEPIPEVCREDRLLYSMESLDRLADIAAECGAVLAVEDLPRSCIGHSSEEISRLISVNDKLRVCFDTNHLLGEDDIAFMKKLGEKIITMHVSDYDFINERHWLPGEGKLDWQKIYRTFLEIGYQGVWMYEVRLAAPNTIIRERDLTFADFYQNAMSIFAGEKPAAIGIPKENLGMWG